MTSDPVFVIDTAIAYGDDTLRHTYSHDFSGRVTEEFVEQWMGESWVNLRRESHAYDAAGNVVSNVIENWVESAWVIQHRKYCTYNQLGLLIEETEEESNSSGVLQPYSRITTEYNHQGRPIRILTETRSSGILELSERLTFLYDSSGNEMGRFRARRIDGVLTATGFTLKFYDTNNRLLREQIWKFQHEAWVGRQIVYSYDDRGNQRESTTHLVWDGEWMPAYRTLSEYDPQDRILQALQQTRLDTQWQDHTIQRWLYDATGNTLSYSISICDSNYWMLWSRDSTEFDQSGRKIVEIHDSWAFDTLTSWSRRFSYDSLGVLVSLSGFHWVNDRWDPFTTGFLVKDSADNEYWYGGYCVFLRYAVLTVSADEFEYTVPSEATLHHNYPNPFNPSTEIRYALPADVRVTLHVYDLLGREIATLVDGFEEAGNKSVRFDASNLPSGMYVYVLHAGNFRDAKKMMLVK